MTDKLLKISHHVLTVTFCESLDAGSAIQGSVILMYIFSSSSNVVDGSGETDATPFACRELFSIERNFCG